MEGRDYNIYPVCAKPNISVSRPGCEFINSDGDCIGAKRWTAAFNSLGVSVWNISMVYTNYSSDPPK